MIKPHQPPDPDPEHTALTRMQVRLLAAMLTDVYPTKGRRYWRRWVRMIYQRNHETGLSLQLALTRTVKTCREIIHFARETKEAVNE